MTTLLVHFVLLGWMSWAIASRLVPNLIDRIVAAAMVFWGQIVLWCLLLSLVGKLSDVSWFFRGSLLQGLALLLLTRRLLVPASEPRLDAPGPGQERSLWLMVAAGATLLPILVANLAIAATYEPNNYDSLTYHLPRVLYYLGQNSLAQFETADFRQVYYPFNYNLLQLFCFVYHAPIQTINFFNVAAWVVTGLGVYRISRHCGCSFNASLIAAWLTLTSTEVLAQATSTTIDLPSGAALVSAMVFALRWRETKRTGDALLSGVAASMSVGTKLTVMFFGPTAMLLLLVFAYFHWHRGETRAFYGHLRSWIGPAVLAGILCAPFVIYNWKATGQLMTHRMDFTLNKPFTFGCVWQTAKAYLVQIFFEPLGRFAFDLDQINFLNRWFDRHVFTHWNEAYAFSPLYLIPPDLNEDHVFFGFAGPLFLICAIICLGRDRRLQRPMSWVALLGLGWFITYFALNKWSLYNQRYFVPPLVLLGACSASVLDAGGGGATALRRAKRLGFCAVAITGLWFSLFYLVKNNIRPAPLPFTHVLAPSILPDLPPVLVERLSDEPRINISSYGTNERIFPLMHLGRYQSFTSGSQLDPGKYNVFSYWKATRNYIYSNLAYYVSYTVVPVATKRTAGVEFLGTVAGSGDSFDYLGLAPHPNDRLANARNNNLAVAVEYNADTNDQIRLNGCRIGVVGLNPGDGAWIEISAEAADGTRAPLVRLSHSGWVRDIAVKKPFKRLVIQVTDAATGKIIGLGELPFTVKRGDTDAPPPNPLALYSSELISDEAVGHFTATGLAGLEGPYAQWDLPRFRWAKQPMVRITIPGDAMLKQIRLDFSVRLQVRGAANLEVLHNGRRVKLLKLQGHQNWFDEVIEIAATPGENIIELADRSSEEIPDWIAYLELNPDVKKYVLAQCQPLEEGAREHYNIHGREEGRPLPMKSNLNPSPPPPDSLYFVYRRLRVEGITSQ